VDLASSQTSPTLLNRLRQSPTDHGAWSTFVARYGPRIYGWCRNWKLQEADARDVTQNVLMRLLDKLRTFEYDPGRSFRGWLRTLTQHACSEFAGARRAAPGSGDAAVLAWLQTVEARADLVARLEEEFDQELFDEAMARVRLRVTPAKWEVFRLMALEGRSGAEVAQRLEMKVATAFVVRSKVQRMIQDEIKKLEGAGPGDGELTPPAPREAPT
jgi:RNA polymerase sigma-70 factor (ECF subfamily)